jgi:hypothetical protein
MSVRRLLARAGAVTGAATALVLVSATAASAHHCYVPMYSLNGPTSSANWIVYTAEGAVNEFFGLELCDAQRDAGYAALADAGLPVGIKIFGKMTIGDGMQGKGQGDERNPNGADGKGMEFFGHGSTLADEMLETFYGTVVTTPCP